MQVDHIVPWANGGESRLDNLQVLCAECNAGKSNRHAD
ncbi:MAG: HNH endonuclease [Actinomycetia bacterium]|nr:HNH endonuclease [Actinomycetes bacterium]